MRILTSTPILPSLPDYEQTRIIGYWPGALDQALLEEAITPLLQAP